MDVLGTEMICDGRTAREIFEEVLANPARKKFGFGDARPEAWFATGEQIVGEGKAQQ